MTATLDIIRAKKERKAQLERALEEILAILKRLGAREVWLFGSLREGNIDVTSDLDLLAIMPNTRSTREWMAFLAQEVTPPIALDLLVFSEEDFQRELPCSSLLQRIIREGKKLL